MSNQGGCSCGTIRFSLSNTPMVTHACHCNDCQRASGAPFVLNMWIEDKYVELTGDEAQCYRSTGGSGKPVDFYFCGKCGTTLWNRYHAAPLNTIWLRASCLDDTSRVKPDMHIHTRHKQAWLNFSDGTRQFSHYYDMRKEWTADSLERFNSVLEELS